MQEIARLDPDDVARAVLLRIVPTGYRLIDDADSRFTGVRQQFIRLAFRHVGAKPSLVGFCAPGTDAIAAARGLAAWAAENIRPTAVQPRVSPGVLVIAIDPPAGNEPGVVAGAAMPAAVWTISEAGVRTRGRPPGAPSPGVLKDVVRRLSRGEPAPTIGHVDVAERTLMGGRGRQRTFALSTSGILVLVIVGYFGLRYLPVLLSPGRSNRAVAACPQTGCLVLDPTQLGSVPVQTTIGQGQTVEILFRGLSDCPKPLDPVRVSFSGCTTNSDQSGVIGTYKGERTGSSELDLRPAGLTGHIVVVVR